ncbi:hypothetical protein MXD61_08895 [Frankia sp. AgPm24]|uniref:hypothetical protein n=1 Tax=Frankia sp. AgPm24 TaxID=631128 RepID=UPI00200F32D8|nr:hypothetical protein [Frankia sp. AgPm24]MCK9921998.1 hypothetical protein [Frankia sp. AgPm24]
MRTCARCGHLVGTLDRPCRACGHPRTRPAHDRHLITQRPSAARLLAAGDVHGRLAAHLRGIAGHVPATLLLSRSRDRGLDLGPIGLPGLVLDPRAGLHVTALAAGRTRGAAHVVMVTTTNAAANIAAYGWPLRAHEGTRLLYTLHARIPYEHLDSQLDVPDRDLFATWFLPLASWQTRQAIPAGELPALARRFHRAWRAAHPAPPPAVLDQLRTRILAGDSRWVSEKAPLAAALTTARPPDVATVA